MIITQTIITHLYSDISAVICCCFFFFVFVFFVFFVLLFAPSVVWIPRVKTEVKNKNDGVTTYWIVVSKRIVYKYRPYTIEALNVDRKALNALLLLLYYYYIDQDIVTCQLPLIM